MSRMHWMSIVVVVGLSGCGGSPDTVENAAPDSPAAEATDAPDPVEETGDLGGSDVVPEDEDAVAGTDEGLPASPPPLIVPAETETPIDGPAAPIEQPAPPEKPEETEVIEE